MRARWPSKKIEPTAVRERARPAIICSIAPRLPPHRVTKLPSYQVRGRFHVCHSGRRSLASRRPTRAPPGTWNMHRQPRYPSQPPHTHKNAKGVKYESSNRTIPPRQNPGLELLDCGVECKEMRNTIEVVGKLKGGHKPQVCRQARAPWKKGAVARREGRRREGFLLLGGRLDLDHVQPLAAGANVLGGHDGLPFGTRGGGAP
jgi:hypothetical protein